MAPATVVSGVSGKTGLRLVKPPRRWKPFTIEHFREYGSRLVFDDGRRRPPEGWQLDFARDLFRGVTRELGILEDGREVLYGSRGPSSFREAWLVVPEANGKTTFVAELALYGADFTYEPWIPIGASTRIQAKILYTQAKSLVRNTPGMRKRFRCFDGYLEVRSLRNGGPGIVVCPWDPNANDGTIPHPYAICDELHRHEDLTLYSLWTGKLKKKRAQIVVISTAGEPGSAFEEKRDKIRLLANQRRLTGAKVIAKGHGIVMHEFMVRRLEDVSDMRKVKAANPLSTNTVEEFAAAFESDTLDFDNWKRLVCNIPTRAVTAAITDEEWEGMLSPDEDDVPEGKRVDVGYDVAWKADTTALVPLGRMADYLLLGRSKVLVPPRDGSSLHPDRVKEAFDALNARTPIDTVVMDMERAEDIAAWLEDDMGFQVVDRSQSNDAQVEDYDNFMQGIRNGMGGLKHSETSKRKHGFTLKHSGCPDLKQHAMNAVARRLPSGKKRFDRPSHSRAKSKQDVRVIDALTAAGMVVTHAVQRPPEDNVPLIAVIRR